MEEIMAMTRQEKLEVQKVKDENENLKTILALRIYPEVLPDIDPPDSGIVNGYAFNLYSRQIYKACTSSTAHNFGDWGKTTSQGSRRLYSTKKLAARAMIAKLSLSFAEELRYVEKFIETCEE